MDRTKDVPENPNAFPFAAEYGHPAACGGMTLRDWFAGQALMAHAMQNFSHGLQDVKPGSERHPEKASRAAYRIADAMLAARKEQQP